MLGVFLSLDLLIFFVFLGDRSCANVLPDQSMGWQKPKLCFLEVYLVHDGRFFGAAPGYSIDRCLSQHYDLPELFKDMAGSAQWDSFLGLPMGTVKAVAFWAFVIAFAIKVPVWPFHTWLPDAHTEAPTAGSMVLAGVFA